MEQSQVQSYWDPRFQQNVLKLMPGDFAVTRDSSMIMTSLGSCVAVCIRDRRSGIGGMNHFMLPESRTYQFSSSSWLDLYQQNSARYGDIAMQWLINGIIREGGERGNFEAKIFGGASISKGSTDIGKGNINFITNYLEMEEIAVVAKDLGGPWPRKLYYSASTGDVWLKKVEQERYNAIFQEDEQYRRKIDLVNKDAEVLFFD